MRARSIIWTLVLIGCVVCLSDLFYEAKVNILGKGLLLLFIIVIIASFLVTYAMHPKSISRTNSELKFIRRYKTIIIPLDTIESISSIKKSSLKHSLRLFGSSGYFGYWGKFYNHKLGKYFIHAEELKDLILVRCENGHQYVIQSNMESQKNLCEFLQNHLHNIHGKKGTA